MMTHSFFNIISIKTIKNYLKYYIFILICLTAIPFVIYPYINYQVEETTIIEVWSGAYGYDKLIQIEGGVISEIPNSEPLTELFYKKQDPKPDEYYASRFFNEEDITPIHSLKVIQIIKGITYEVNWRPNTDKWREHEIWLQQFIFNSSITNTTDEGIITFVPQSLFSFNILGIETSKIEGFTSWFTEIKEGRFLEPGENDAIIISSYVSEELGLSVGDTINVPLGGINEFNVDLEKRVDTRQNKTLHIVGIINSGYEVSAIMDLNALIDALKSNAGERSYLLPFYNKLFIKVKSEDVNNVTSELKIKYPDAAFIIRGN